MKMIDYKQGPTLVQKQLKHALKITLTLTTYKRDRRLIIKKTEEDYFIKEEGYYHQTFTFDNEKEMIKQLKKQMKIEFPRSHKLYMDIKEE